MEEREKKRKREEREKEINTKRRERENEVKERTMERIERRKSTKIVSLACFYRNISTLRNNY